MLTSPGWPNANYPNRVDCLWLLVAEEGHRIVLRFIEFQLVGSGDFLYCGNGDKFQDALLTLTGYVVKMNANYMHTLKNKKTSQT